MARPYPKFTYEDYLLLPDDKRYEIIEGDLMMMVHGPNTRHQEIIGKLYRYLSQFVEDNNLGIFFIAPFDVILSRYDVVQPDLIFVSKGREHIITEMNIQGAPDLVIEIMSQDRERDQVIKKKLYAKYGIKEYWLVDSETQTVEIMRLNEKGYRPVALFEARDILTSAALSSLKLDLTKIFAAHP